MSGPQTNPTEQMAPETLEALKGSIAKWEAIVAGTGEDRGWKNCPLCRVFADLSDDNNDSCVGCPVSKATGLSGCDGSPYERWYDLTFYTMWPTAKSDEEHQAAQAELDFLKSLLPKEAV